LLGRFDPYPGPAEAHRGRLCRGPHPAVGPGPPTVGGGASRALLTRRGCLPRTNSGRAVPSADGTPRAPGSARPASAAPEQVFPQSVASGDPSPHGALLWTRVALSALGPSGPREVCWVVARDPELADVLVSGTTSTDESRDGTVKVFVDDPALEPATRYWYRFTAGGVHSRTGRLRTLPAADQSPERLRLGYTSCQDWTNGYFTALGALAETDVDYVLHLGDYVYETTGAHFQGSVRSLELPSGADTAHTLADYRALYRTYKTDPHLQRCHEQHTFLVTWDDHEFTNDGWGDHASGTADPPADPERRSAANRAWAEFLPTACHLTSGTAPDASVRYDPDLPATEQVRLWREVHFGTLAHVFFTDERLHRDGHACGERTREKYLVAPCADVGTADRTMLGAQQREWFTDHVSGSTSTWKVWANETMLLQLKLRSSHLAELLDALPDAVTDRLPAAVHGVHVSLDQWDGYQAERTAIARRLLAAGVTDLVTLTGDLHSSVAGWSRADYDAEPPLDLAAVAAGRIPADPPRGDLLGTCFMSTSVSAANLVELLRNEIAQLLHLPLDDAGLPGAEHLVRLLATANPHLALFESNTHGFNVAEFTSDGLEVTMWAVESVLDPDATGARVAHRFRVPRQGGPGLAPVLHRIV